MKKILLSGLLLILPMVFCANFAFASSSSPDSLQITNGAAWNKFADRTGYKDPNESQDELPDVIGEIIAQVLGLMGVIFAVLIIYSGIRWMTAAGDSGRVEKAKNILINSVIGLIITLAAYSISYAVIEILLKSTSK